MPGYLAAGYHGTGTLTYTEVGLPPGATLNSTSGLITGTLAATADVSAPYAVSVVVSDGAQSASLNFNWSVSAVVSLASVPDQYNAGGDSVSLALSATDAQVIPAHHVVCYRASDGQQLWDTEVPAGTCLVNDYYHGYAVPTPVTDGKQIFALFGSGVIAALDFDGKILWRQELAHKGADSGICASLVLFEDSVILSGIANPGLHALDKKTGKVKWQQMLAKGRPPNRCLEI